MAAAGGGRPEGPDLPGADGKGQGKRTAKGEAEAKRIVRQAQQQAEEIFAQLDQLRKEQQKQANVQALNDAKAAVRHHLKTAEEQLHLRDEEQEPAYTPPGPSPWTIRWSCPA